MLVDGEACGMELCVLHMLEIFSWGHHPEFKETLLLLLSPLSEINKRDGEGVVVHRICAKTMLITNEM